ncbi:uncharacterized protein N7483_009323 [Penicillium malachiteum]|uniref:uncharacterized protein n=1 Tax=Penicillium malachiteum TaxID=1324776 RepID=UPI0025476D48|nr:uncharacterized protein N7483_009323 [Penicillium malachiteum]KAJ5721389.1 hypothetical protein N7483_009323 [Penicillium malachiteum]
MADGKQSWWQAHYRWVIMVIVLVIGFGLIAAVGVWLRRRHDLKKGRLLGPGRVYGNPLVNKTLPPQIQSASLSQSQSQSGVLPVSTVPSQQSRSIPASTRNSSHSNISSVPVPTSKRLQKPNTVAEVEHQPETSQVSQS